MNIEQEFKVYCSTNLQELLNKDLSVDLFDNDDELLVEGLASNTHIDEDGDFMTPECLEDMKRQAMGLNILKDHGRSVDDILGKVVQVLESNTESFRIKFKILPKWKYYVKELLDNEVNLGLSIGAKAIDFEPNESDSYGWKINKVKLYEISLVSLPANWDSFGSVKFAKELNHDDNVIVAKCFNGACKELVKQHSVDVRKELEDGDDEKSEYPTRKEVINMMNEMGISMYDDLLSEALDELKRELEKYFANNHTHENSNDVENDKDKNSSIKEDKEKQLNMTEEQINEIDAEVSTPNQEMEEIEETSVIKEEKVEMEKQIKEPVETIESSDSDVLKSINELKTFFTDDFKKELHDEIHKWVKEEVQSEREQLREEIRKEEEEALFKELSTERKPEATSQPQEEIEEEEEDINKAMNTYDIAKMLVNGF